MIGVRDECDGKGTLTLWSGAFASDYEGTAERIEGGYRIEMWDGRTGTVASPKRSDRNFDRVDALLNAAINGVLSKQ